MEVGQLEPSLTSQTQLQRSQNEKLHSRQTDSEEGKTSNLISRKECS